ncbi:ferredoxin [Occultella gossypii]|uniref:Ferredoxin n=1 Tax=Occultella gossypii TaxID=2800820 RepID=A0ABS7SEX5_9MICO|nr:ferredoxin [Occultella gossypii]MBZ2198902.1 ferredoxin [Occultella gossypii]
MVEVVVDSAACVGAGQCALTAPQVFDQDDDGIVVLLAGVVTDVSAVRQAAQLCPARAITVIG